MQLERRGFLKQAGTLAAGALTLSRTNLFAADLSAAAGTIKTFGIQLYSVRDDLPKDPKGVMTKLASMGYKQFESYAGDKGFLWGMKPKEIKAFLGDQGVKMVSTHFNFGEEVKNSDALKKSIDMASEAGLSYLLCPYIGPQKSWDAWKKIADDFNRVGEQANKSGLKFGYHNHDYSFKPLDGKLPQDYLLAHTDPKHVMFELDLCWIEAAGQDAVAHLKQYGKRYELCHVKDYRKTGDKVVQQDLGKGEVNYKKILRSALDNGMKYFLVEQEEYPQSPLVSVKADAQYMKNLTV